MKIISYNINGIRAAIKKDFLTWLKVADPDILCLQEVKAYEEQVELDSIKAMGYEIYWYPAEKKGYSGVAIFTKIAPQHVEYGCGIKDYDQEGRILRADFKDFSLSSVYIPSGSSGDARQDFKMQYLRDFLDYTDEVKKSLGSWIICGDYNICHKAIDIHNPVANKNTSGFLPEEREWMSEFLTHGWLDSFRHFNQDPHQYTWWSYRARAREKNLGWRIDYHMVTEALREKLKSTKILSEAYHSDHCPILLEIE